MFRRNPGIMILVGAITSEKFSVDTGNIGFQDQKNSFRWFKGVIRFFFCIRMYFKGFDIIAWGIRNRSTFLVVLLLLSYFQYSVPLGFWAVRSHMSFLGATETESFVHTLLVFLGC